jgi:hypothetical protein
MGEKTQSLESRLARGESIFDIGRDPSMELDLSWCAEVDKILTYQDTASELQIDKIKDEAISALKDLLFACDDPVAINGAAKTLLAHYRSEKLRLESRRKEKANNPDQELAGTARDIFGGWNLKNPTK